MTHVRAQLYRLDTLEQFETHVAHLYEHLVVMRLHALLEEHGYNSRYIGWIGGETYHRRIFLDIGLYDPAAATLLHDFLLQPKPHIDLADIDHEIRSIEAEKKSLVTVTNKPALIRALKKLDSLHWICVDDDMSPAQIDPITKGKPPKILTLQPSAKSFRDIIANFYIKDVTPDELALFSRLTPTILDTAALVLDDMDIYEQDNSGGPGYKPTGSIAGVAITGTIRRKSATNRAIQQRLADEFAHMDVSRWQQSLDRQFDAYVATHTWSHFPYTNYDRTGLVASRQYVRSLATTKNINALFARLEGRVETRTDHVL